MFSLKIIRTLAITTVFVSCTQSAGKQSAKSTEMYENDSADFYPAMPKNMGIRHNLSKAEYRKYYRAAKAFYDSTLGDNPNFSGSMLVAKNGVVVFEKTHGYFNTLTRKDTLTEHSPFHIASVSKTFTAMAILHLMERGKLNLDDDLSIHFPNFPYPGTNIKMLLNHRSGLPNYVHYLDKLGWDKKKKVSNTDVLESLYSMHPPLNFKTGTHFSYCNTNYALLALIIEKVSGLSYPDFMKKTFFSPLQLQDTYVYTQADSARSMPSAYWNNRLYANDFLDNVYGDKNIYSTTHDILKWDQALYNGTLFKQATLDSAFAGYSFQREGKRNYGLGWRIIFLNNNKKIIYHNGWWHGNNATFIRLIDEQATIIVLGNRFTTKIYHARKLCDTFGDYQQNKSATDDGEGEEPATKRGRTDSTAVVSSKK
jgi:CubicO group peptidase (beta-lactamase class C family)